MDSDEEIDFQPSWRGVPGTIILINAFENSKHNIFATVHVATCRLIRQHLRSSSSQNISVCIFGTEETTASAFDSKPVVEIIPLTSPSLDDYNKLKNSDITSFKEAKELKLSDVLWHCSKTFANCKKQLSSRTVIMLTYLDTPPIGVDQKPTLNRAIDLVDASINIRIINVSQHEYKIDTYYEKLLTIANRGLDFVMPKPIWDSEEIEKLMYQESHRHLAVAKINFEIGENFNIGVGLYTLLKRPGQNGKTKVNLDRDTNTVLTSMTKTMKVTLEDGEDSQPKQIPLLKSELLHYQDIGGERIEFTDSEKKLITNPFGPPMLKLLGFKPATIVCKEKWYLKMGYFLFPNESIIEGSTVAFKALHRACKDMDMVAICVLSPRVNAKPLIVALSPCSRPLNLDVEVGFDVIIIPFVESVRELNINEDDENEASPSVEKAHKRLMSNILNKITIDYKADMFINPKLELEYRAIEAIALEDDDNEPFIDTTKANPDKFKDIDEDLFEELFGPFGALSIKRTASSSTQSGTKKQKVDDIDESLLSARLQNEKVNEYTVPQLKQILKYKDIKNLPALTGLKKSELVELVYKHC
ncbi:X-ray repair cross-complementing protein 6 [Vanessa atalanta]|uniref:X-ray repair cross-complementing protein 6 n=1 Tax=Vanessa atalanta TaxID=42275 RepID=UPI001FCD005E|nr:X-ray repair cross-complementing protein 6 [Vanessa atalanta]